MIVLDFKTSFRSLTTIDDEYYDPFPWQARLYELMWSGVIPGALDIPTGLGKTSVMAIWLLARAVGAKVPRRLIYVVDRRAVVDQATRYAQILRERLENETCKQIRDGLGLKGLLPISTLRGQFADNQEWLADITSPAIIIGTVDMIGSRILFQGYGVSTTMRPMQAALLATDSLLVLDEAHLSQPFARMVEQVCMRTGPDGLRMMTLSATHETQGNTFRITKEDHLSAIVRRRLEARKTLTIEDRPGAKPDEFAKAAFDLLQEHPGARILVYRNSFDDAVKIGTALHKLTKKSSTRVILLTGQRRGIERDALVTILEEAGFVGSNTERNSDGAILVATSAGEVGIDLDADHMLCDMVSWERMVQRLGRVNRRGDGDATVTVWDLADAHDEAESDRRKATRTLLMRLPGEETKQAGPAALSEVNGLSDAKDASTPAPLYPALTGPLLDAWAMTSLQEHDGRPEVEPWLRGWVKRTEPQTTIVWRAHLPTCLANGKVTVDAPNFKNYLVAAPLKPSEKLESSSKRTIKWLKDCGRRLAKRRTEGLPALAEADIAVLIFSADGNLVKWLTFRSLEDGLQNLKQDEISGRTMIVRQSVAGLDCDRNEKSGPVAGSGVLEAKVDALPPTADTAPDQFKDTGWRIATLARKDETLVASEDGPQIARFVTRLGAGGEELEGFAVLRKQSGQHECENARTFTGTPQSLFDHTEEVLNCVTDFAESLGLDVSLKEALRTAARHHDQGKAAEVWQHSAGAEQSGGPWAKTSGHKAQWNRLQGYRHEFGSLVNLDSRNDLPEKTRDLILHLVAAHHGRARPLLSHKGLDDLPPTRASAIAGDAALRFARLQQHYGPWKLAWLEAVLRAADQKASRAHEERSHG